MTSSVPATVADVSSTRSEYTDHGTSSPSRHYLRRWGDSYNASTSSTTSTTSQHHLALNHQHHRLSSTNNSQWWLKHPPKLENTTRGGNNFSPGELLPATTLRSALMSGSASGSVVTFMDGASLGSGSGAGSFRRSGSVGSGWGSSASRQSCGSASAFGSGIPQPPQLLHFGNNNNNNSNVPRTSTRTVAGSMDESETNDSGRKRVSVGVGVGAQPVNVPGLLRECPSESDPQLRLPLPPTTAKSGGHPSFLRRWSEKIESANQQQQQQQQPTTTTTTTTSGAPVLPPRVTPTSSTSNIHTHTFDLDFASLTQVEDDLVHAAQMELQQEVNDTSLNAVPISEKLQQVQCAMTNWGFAEKVSNTTSARGGGGDASCSLPAIMREESTSLRAVHEDQACRRFLGLVHRASPTGTHTARHYDRQLLLPSVSASLHSSRMPGKRSSAGSFSDRFGGATQDIDGNSAHNTSPPRRMVLSRSSPVLAVADREDELSVLSLFSGPSHAR